MRIAFIGTSAISVATTQLLLQRGHEVILVERDHSVIEELSQRIDCGFVHGDGSRPAILLELDPKHTDLLFCLTNNDETNIIASLVGRSLGFRRVVTQIEDPELEHICIELGLEDTIIPTRTIARYLGDLVAGRDPLELSALVGADVHLFAFVANGDDLVEVQELKLPRRARVAYLYRNGELRFPDPDEPLHKGDEVVVAHRDELGTLAKRWGAKRGPATGG